ncbi:beta-1,4-mannosyltransferase egh-like [Mizuhopecten yessoensis]|uniref:Beta-1,4-mannosyltransferase egh n=1 Tax=Mizuhopecten yessoensis TaxID=6573 RepID=A0A210PZL1_MIZYE|nr:beta-1,4-mannosyltransferase egh-like [Mizuhopecten yessoensis]XP_021371144.1 beta-1,4-mannosyltransferase egh-like [Mizuhopecten yessoensis]OWF41915.1 Beta-1,4-mannosyltransferase egh [Mizuhopecten yessoensis]
MKFVHQSGVLHLLVLCILFTILAIFIVMTGTFGPGIWQDFDPYKKYGKWPTILMYIMRLLTLVPLPLSICNFLGIVMFNTFPEKPKVKSSTLFGPFLCFRVVTRGTFPELVRKNVSRNIAICSELGLDNYIFEVVTDTAINLTKSSRTREVVVPAQYQSANGCLYKARALQYCLEDSVNVLSDNDWIIHLDEETLLTESCVIGIINFIKEGLYSFGQGVITYANEEIVNWITTIADLVRVGVDYGIIRYTLKYLHKPLFSWKGSYVVANVAAEKKITFDFGSEGSIAEDCFFALSAWREGYKFGFIEGEMWEKSTFSLMDFIRQRKRWVQGIIMVLLSRQIPARNKFGISVMVLSWLVMPITVPNLVLVPLYPLPMPNIINFLCGFMGGVMLFLFVFGAVKSFNYRRTGLLKFLFLCICPILLMPVCIVMETCGVTWALISRKQGGFHIVKKETTPSRIEV